jgi:hypothetical protein
MWMTEQLLNRHVFRDTCRNDGGFHDENSMKEMFVVIFNHISEGQ